MILMAHIYPQPEDFTEVANQLFELAGDPREVATTTEGPVPLGLVVSDDLYQRWQDSLDSEPSDQDQPKKRGRPRKVAAPEQEPTP